MTTGPVCGAVRHLAAGALTCGLPPEHTTPTADAPQGSPHADSSHPDTLTGDPTRWWG